MFPQKGCPTKCKDARRALVRPLECVDKSVQDWGTEPVIQAFLAFTETWPWGVNQQKILAEIRRVRNEGCQALQTLRTTDARYVADALCFDSVGSDGMYLSYFCPLACGCQNVSSDICLPSCARGAVPEAAGCASGMCSEGALQSYKIVKDPGGKGALSCQSLEFELHLKHQTNQSCHRLRVLFSKECCRRDGMRKYGIDNDSGFGSSWQGTVGLTRRLNPTGPA